MHTKLRIMKDGAIESVFVPFTIETKRGKKVRVRDHAKIMDVVRSEGVDLLWSGDRRKV